MWPFPKKKSRSEDRATFQLPAAPPTGRRVRSARTGDIFCRQPAAKIQPMDGHPEVERVLLLWGQWRREGTEEDWAWGAVLAEFGPLIILDDDQDEKQARLYGPVGQRWGDPNQPCPYDSCILGIYHVGPHELKTQVYRDARVMDFLPDFAGPARTDPAPCTCGHPQGHLPICARYVRMAGPEQDSPAS